MIDIKICESCRHFIHKRSSFHGVTLYLCDRMYGINYTNLEAFGMTKKAYEGSLVPKRCGKQGKEADSG